MASGLAAKPAHDRLPSSIAAERAVLGACILDGAVAEVGSVLLVGDFHFTAHRKIWTAMLALHHRKVPIDYITLSDELERTHDLEGAGGAEYLTTLTEGLPRGINVTHHAGIVREKAIRRALLRCGGSAEALAMDDSISAAEGLKRILEQISGIVAQAGKAESETLLVQAQDFLATTSEEIDWLVEGVVQRGANGVFAADPKGGKAQPDDTPIPTPCGWRPMGELKVGDQVFGVNGRPQSVVAVHVQGPRPVFRVTLCDGSFTDADAGHLWTVLPHSGRGKTVTLDTLAVRAIIADNERYAYLPLPAPIERPTAKLEIAPYTMGCLIANGGLTVSVTICTPDTDVIARVEAELPEGVYLHAWPREISYSISAKRNRRNPVKESLKRLGLFGHKSLTKFIPVEYLNGSVAQRVDLLRGLMDGDGTVRANGNNPSYSTSSPALARDTVELVQSLGGTASVRPCPAHYRDQQGRIVECATSYRITIHMPEGIGCPFWSARKAAKWNGAGRPAARVTRRRLTRRIVSVEPVGTKPCRCITVSNRDGLYLTEAYIATHNSFSGLDLALSLATGQRWMEFAVKRAGNVALISREDNPGLTRWRLGRLMAGREINREELGSALWVNTREQSKLFFLDNQIHVGRMVQALKRAAPDFVILDVFNTMHMLDENDQSQMRSLMNTLNGLQSELGCAVCLMHHFRKSDGVGEKTLVQRLRGSSAIAGWVEWMVGLSVEDNATKLRKMEFELKAAESPEPRYFRIESDDAAKTSRLVRDHSYRPAVRGQRRAAADIVGKAVSKPQAQQSKPKEAPQKSFYEHNDQS